MSVGRNLQEMENVVTKGAASAEPMHNIAQNPSGVMIPGQTGAWEDLGGPTPQNYRPDDSSAALRTPGATLAQVKNVVNAKASAAEGPRTSATPVAAPGQGVREETEDDEDLIDEEEFDEDEEVVSEASEEDEDEEDEDEEEEEDKKKGKKKVEEEFDIEEDVNALLAGEDLSEEFQEKARTIFEAAIKTKVSEIKEQLQETYENALIEEVEFIKEEFLKELIPILSMLLMNGFKKMLLQLSKVLKPK